VRRYSSHELPSRTPIPSPFLPTCKKYKAYIHVHCTHVHICTHIHPPCMYTCTHSHFLTFSTHLYIRRVHICTYMVGAYVVIYMHMYTYACMYMCGIYRRVASGAGPTHPPITLSLAHASLPPPSSLPLDAPTSGLRSARDDDVNDGEYSWLAVGAVSKETHTCQKSPTHV
jgi:hypothetical protein